MYVRHAGHVRQGKGHVMPPRGALISPRGALTPIIDHDGAPTSGDRMPPADCC